MQKEYTKPQLTRWEKQRRRQRYVLFGGIGLIAVIIVGLFTAWFFENQYPLYKAVVDVNGSKITMAEYVKTLRALGQGQPESSLLNIASYTVSLMEQAELISQEAAAQNISITDDEVNKYMKDNNIDSGLYPIIRANLLTDKLKQNYFKPQVPTTADQRNIEAMFLESDEQAAAVRAQLEAGAGFSDLAASNSLDSYTKENKGELGMHPQQVIQDKLGSAVPGDFAFSSEVGSLSQPRPDADKQKALGYWLIQFIEAGTGDNEGKINVRAMLLSSEQEADQIRSEIVDGGQDFSTIANEKSQYNTGGQNGGLIGFIAKGTMSDAFDAAAFTLDQPGQISLPVKDVSQYTKGGSWLVKVIDSATGAEISADDITILTGDLYNVWFATAQSNAKINNFLTSASTAFAIEKATGK